MHVLYEEDDFLLEAVSKSERMVQFLVMLKGMLKSPPDTFKKPVMDVALKTYKSSSIVSVYVSSSHSTQVCFCSDYG